MRGKTLLDGDTLLLVIFLIFSLSMIAATGRLENEATKTVPRLFGQLGLIFAVAALSLKIFSKVKGYEKERGELEPQTKPLTSVEIEGAMNLYVAILLVLLYVPLVKITGFVVASVLEIAAFLWFAGYRKILFGLLYAVVLSVGIYVLFHYFLKVDFPRGLFLLI